MKLIPKQFAPIPHEIQMSFEKFQKDHSDPTKTAFIMMSFSKSAAHIQIANVIRGTLRSFGIVGLRADDKEYHSDLYFNMLTYVHGCQFGVAVFDLIQSESFNPNVSFEVGYMFGIGKEVCLLKDDTVHVLQADLIGKLYSPFNPHQVSETLPPVLKKWLNEKGFGSEIYSKLVDLYEKLVDVASEYILLLKGDKTDREAHARIIRDAQDLCERAAEYDEPCPAECLNVHTEADADELEFRKVNDRCKDRLLYIARKRLTRYQPTMKDNPLEGKIWGEYDQRNREALYAAMRRIERLWHSTHISNQEK